MLAVVLVVLVIFLFLRNVPATIIPSLSVPLSLVGTFGVMYLLGFSLNNLSLMALTIATGFVVDDAIVMIENIARYVEEGEPPLEAALKGSEQIGFTIISLTVSLIAVLIPLLFMGDVVGRLFREFAVTLAVTILISAVRVADAGADAVRQAAAPPDGGAGELASSARIANGSTALVRFYDRTLGWVLDHQALTLIVAVATLVLTVLLYIVDPQGLLPGAGHRPHPRHLRGARNRFPSTPWRQRQQALAAVDPQGSGRARACRRSSASTAPTSRSTAAAC